LTETVMMEFTPPDSIRQGTFCVECK